MFWNTQLERQRLHKRHRGAPRRNITDCHPLNANIDSDVFYAWTTQDLLPKLPPHSVLVLDNATFHKRNDIQEAIQSKGHTLMFLPPYSPDLNPSEHKWAQAKAIRRKSNKTLYELFKHIF